MADEFEQYVVEGQDSPAGDDFSDYLAPGEGDTTGGKLDAFVEGSKSGLVTSTPTVAGAWAGAKVGAAATRSPYGMVGGAVVGGAAGMMVGAEAKEQLEIGSIDDMPVELRPAYSFGETLTASIPPMLLPFVKAGRPIADTLGQSKTGAFLRGITDFATRNKAAFIASEGSAAVSASVAGATVEAMDPGNTPVKTGAEVAAGMLNPTSHFAKMAPYLTSKVSELVKGFTYEGRKTAAAQVLQDVFERYGEDPQMMARIIATGGLEIDGVKIDSTVAQQTGSKALSAIEGHLSKKSDKFGEESKRMGQDALDAVDNLIIKLNSTGDPTALKIAAELRQQSYREMLTALETDARNATIEAASKITTNTPADKSKISAQAYDALSSSMRLARDAEAKLWSEIPEKMPSQATNLKERFSALKAQLLTGESLPNAESLSLESFIKDLTKNGSDTESLTRFRSLMLNESRKADAAGDPKKSRFFGMLAESALDDLDDSFKNAGPAASAAYQDARAFSFELNEVFTRSFAGKAKAVGRFGERIPPETMLRRAVASGNEISAVHMTDLREATEFMVNKSAGEIGEDEMKTMLDAQDRILRLVASDSLDENGLPNVKKMRTFMKNHAETLERFPSIKDDLNKAMLNSKAMDRVMESVKYTQKQVENTSVFARIAKVENPSSVVRKTLSGPTPVSDLRHMISISKRADEADRAVDGFKTSLFDAVMKNTQSKTGKINPDALRSSLNQPLAAGEPSLIELMVSEGVMDAADVRLTDQMFDAMKNIQTALDAGTALDEVSAASDVLTDAVIGMIGASVGGKVSDASGSSAHPLIVAGASSRAAKEVLKRVPQGRVQEVLIEAMTNRDLMTELLKKSKTPEQKVESAKRIHAYLIQAGIIGLDDQAQGEE